MFFYPTCFTFHNLLKILKKVESSPQDGFFFVETFRLLQSKELQVSSAV